MARRTVLGVGLWCVGSAFLSGCGNGTVAPVATTTVTVASSATSADASPTTSTVSTGPKGKVFDNSAIQSRVAKILADDYRIANVGEVACPAGQEVKAGATFQCTVTVAGKQQKVPITVKDADGDYEVFPPR